MESLEFKSRELMESLDNLIKDAFKTLDLDLKDITDLNEEQFRLVKSYIQIFEDSKEFMILNSKKIDSIERKLDQLLEKQG